VKNIKVIDLAKEGTLLPAPPGTCPECAVKHEPEQPHNQQSLFYQYRFYHENGRWPNWRDAMSHCSDEVKAAWIKGLAEVGVKV
jgi:hypothetical protein